MDEDDDRYSPAREAGDDVERPKPTPWRSGLTFWRGANRKQEEITEEDKLRNPYDPHPQALAKEWYSSGRKLRQSGHLFTERDWPDGPEDGPLQLQDGIDIACFYCILCRIYSTEIYRGEFAERRYETTDLLHQHVANFHIDALDGSHRGVELRAMILCQDGVTERIPEPAGLAVPISQKEAAPRAGWRPAWPMNKPVRREPSRSDEENRAVDQRERGFKDDYLWDEVPRLRMRDEITNDWKRYRSDGEKIPVKTDRYYYGVRDFKQPGLSAFVQYQNGTLEKVPCGQYLGRKASGHPMALCMISEHDESRTEEFQDLVLADQAALVRHYKFDHSEKNLCVARETWMDYGEYLAKKRKWPQWRAIIANMRDGLGRGNPETTEYLNGEFQKIIKESQRELAGWVKAAGSFEPDLMRQRGWR